MSKYAVTTPLAEEVFAATARVKTFKIPARANKNVGGPLYQR